MPEKIVWKTLEGLIEPFNDAVNYKSRQEKEFFNKIFLRTDALTDCLKPSVYYLIGEKGSGKTAYAVYLENNDVEKARCKLSTMTESQYARFIAMKKAGKLSYSDYPNIWRPMLLNMMCQALVFKSKDYLASFTGKFDLVEEEINRFNEHALNPEVEVAFEMINEGGLSAKAVIPEIGELGGNLTSRESDKTERIKHHLLTVEDRLKQAIADLRLTKNHVLFVDGIDYRPESVPYKDYLACVKGLGEAVWQLNTEFFANIRDSKGRLKVVLLVRPDVFHELNLYNSNSRLQDNSVLLEWSTTVLALRDSNLYNATGKYFSSQQDHNPTPVEAAGHYLSSPDAQDSLFKRLLRSSFHKPRDLLTFIRIARRVSIKSLGRGREDYFASDIARNPDFTRDYSDYLLGEVRNYSAFYMSQQDFSLYIKFFQYLDGKQDFTFADFQKAFDKFKGWIRGEIVDAKEYIRDAEALLQFFYDVNIIGYRETVGADLDSFVHYSFRERSLNNLSPKVKSAGILMINIGVAKALDVGLRAAPANVEVPTTRKRQRRPAKGNREKHQASLPVSNGESAGLNTADLPKKQRYNTASGDRPQLAQKVRLQNADSTPDRSGNAAGPRNRTGEPRTTRKKQSPKPGR